MALGWPGKGHESLITKDKFCMRRRERLALSVSRREVYTTPTKLEEPAHSRAYPPYESTHHGGANETPVPRPPGSGGTPSSAGTGPTRASFGGTSRPNEKQFFNRSTRRRCTMRVAAYVRVSTSRQVRLQTIEQQLERVLGYVRQKGWQLLEEEVFRDDGYSGTSLKRPALDALRDRARMRELDLVVVLSPDRLARNYVHQMVLIEELENDGCRVEFVERPMSSEPNDQLLLQIRGAVAEYERTLLTERMRRGKLAKLKAGLLLPWVHTPYGYRTDPDRPRDPAGLDLDEAKAAVVGEIFAMYLEEGESLFGVS